jgi:glycosyltransferase involved in cell wall biosynthesis
MEVVVIVESNPIELITRLLDRLKAVAKVQCLEIASYSRAWNMGADVARGADIIFLKDDVCVRSDTICATLSVLNNEKGVGAVGAMLLDGDGVLIESGSLLNSSGICRSVGRGWNPDDYRVQYRRDVAFCSGAYLGMAKDTFQSIGGFDESYLDEYYEDVDLCLRLNCAGKRIVYDPCSIVTRNLEFRDSWESAAKTMAENRNKLLVNREFELASFPSQSDFELDPVHECTRGQRVLWIEDAPPFAHMGAGFPRTKEMLRALIELGHSVTLLPTFITTSDFADVYKDTPREVEVALGVGAEGFEEFWQRRGELYDAVIISRPNNLSSFGRLIEDTKSKRPGLRLIYDAEAVFANREISEALYNGEPFSESEEKQLLEAELKPAKAADAILSISEHERKQFGTLGFSNVVMLRHHSAIEPTVGSFSEREGILFVGAVHSDSAPNAIGLIDFIENSLPLIRAKLGHDIKLYCAGRYHSDELMKYASDSEVFLGFVEDLSKWYEKCRLFIAPARFAAGIPLKIIEAASKGIPVVATTLARSQLGWTEKELVSADTAEAFADACVRAYSEEPLWQQLRVGALAKVRQDYSREHIVEALRCALE